MNISTDEFMVVKDDTKIYIMDVRKNIESYELREFADSFSVNMFKYLRPN